MTARRHGFRSAYTHGPDAFTTSKWRDTVQTRVIDYIWITADLDVAATLAMPPVSLLLPTHLPLLEFPSDHLSIAALLVPAGTQAAVVDDHVDYFGDQ